MKPLPSHDFDIWRSARAELENINFCGMGHEAIVSKSQNLVFYSRGKVKLRILEDLLEPNITTNSTPETLLYVSVLNVPVELYILSENETMISK